MSKISLLPSLAYPDGDELVPVSKGGRVWRANLSALASRLVAPLVVATMEENSPSGTGYRITPPAGVDLTVHGAKFSFIIPEDNLSADNAYILIPGVLALKIEMVIGQTLRGRWRADFTTNRNGGRFTLDQQTPEAVSLQALLTDAGHVDVDRGPVMGPPPSTPSHWVFKSRQGTNLGRILKFSFIAPFTCTGPTDITIDGFTARLRKSAGNDLSASDIKALELITVEYPAGDQNSWFVVAKGIAQDAPPTPTPEATDLVELLPNDPNFELTDHSRNADVTRTASELSVIRPVAGDASRYVSPGTRVTCRVKTPWIEYKVRMGRRGGYLGQNAVASVLVDGAPVATTVSYTSDEGIYTQIIRATIDASAFHDVTLVFPYARAMAVLAYRTPRAAVFAIDGPTPRPTDVFLAAGDSITQGDHADNAWGIWSVRVAANLNMRLVNQGYNGRRLVASDGSIYGAENATITHYMIGTNDVSIGTPIADFKDRLLGFCQNFFAAHAQGIDAVLILASPIWGENGDGGAPSPIPGPQYRAAMAQFVQDHQADWPQLRYSNGLGYTNGPGAGQYADGTHPMQNTIITQMVPRITAAVRPT